MHEPFDPFVRASEVENIVMEGSQRKYYRFRYSRHYGGIVTADAVGCNILCAYCWIFFRNQDPKKVGTYYSPAEVADKTHRATHVKLANIAWKGTRLL